MAAITNSRYVPPVPSNLPRSTSTLLRLVQLQEIFQSEYPKSQRPKAIEAYAAKVKTLEGKCLKSPDLETLEKAVDNLEWGIADVYQVAKQTSEEKVIACAKRMLKDAYSLVVPPVKRSYAGLEGPVFLVEYPRGEKSKAYVIKWTNRNECCASRVYDQLSTFLGHPKDGLGFSVPHSMVFDFAQGLRECPNGEVHKLTSEERELLQQNFDALLIQVPFDESREEISPASKEVSPEERRIAVTERILGENLLDFSYTKYPSLDFAQKNKLFTRLGRLAFLDLLVGNWDRLFRIRQESGEFSFENKAEANLGNVMLVLRAGKEPPLVYAIDNAMDLTLVQDSTVRANYLAFLTRLYSDPGFMVDQLASNMVACMKVYALPDFLSGGCQQNRQHAKAHLALFNQDLEQLGYAAFSQGIREMLDCLVKEKGLISLWYGEEGAFLRDHLQGMYPEFLDSLQERLDIFQFSKKEEV